MNYKVEKTLKDGKKYIIVFIILWLVIDIVLIAPIAVSIAGSTINGVFNLNLFLEQFIAELTGFKAITKAFDSGVIGIFGKATLWMTIIELIFFVIGLVKSKPKNEFTDIEHGSSDWSEGGEQYKILSKKKGIILAENNYLPVDKRGNVNVLVVGRFWFRKVSFIFNS